MPATTDTSHCDTPARVVPHALTEQDAARYIGFSAMFLRQSRMHGRRRSRTPGPPYVKVGRSVRYLRPDLDEWLQTHRRELR